MGAGETAGVCARTRQDLVRKTGWPEEGLATVLLLGGKAQIGFVPGPDRHHIMTGRRRLTALGGILTRTSVRTLFASEAL